jgi:hypothetical protein
MQQESKSAYRRAKSAPALILHGDASSPEVLVPVLRMGVAYG